MSRNITSFIFLLALSLLLATPAAVAAETIIVAGEVSGTWTAAGSPYLVEGDITVPTGATLTIEPGVQVLFQSWYKLTINGTLLAQGNAGAPILFGGGHPTAGWQGIDFINAANSSQLSYAIVENGRATGAAPQNSGGGIYIENTSPTISYSTIRNNFAKVNGGGLYLTGSNAKLIGNTIANNTAGQGASAAGGGLYMVDSSPEVSGNVISGNQVYIAGSYSTPNGRGGAIFANRSNPILRQNLIIGNYVEGHLNSNARGGALYLTNSDPDLINNTISGNAVTNDAGVYSIKEGGAIYADRSNPTTVNTILWNNVPQEIFVNSSGSSSITVAYANLQGGQAGIVANGATVNWLDGNIDADPLFVDPGADDFQLQANSPAIDAGTDFFEWGGQTLIDLDATAYNGLAPDLGSVESGNGGSPNAPPLAVAAANPDHGSAPLIVQFSATGSIDADGTIVAYTWDFGDGNSSTEANPTYTYNNVGLYQATLTVTDDDGAAHSAAVSIDVVDGTTIGGGELSGTWTAAGSPYRIAGDVTIPTGATLMIEPGVEILFQDWYKLTVNGTLLAEGSVNAPILFGGGHPTAGWLGIRFIDAADDSRLTYVIVEKGRATGASPEDSGGGIYIQNTSPTISSSTIRNNYAKASGGGVYLVGSSAKLIGNTIANNAAGQGASAFGGGIYMINTTTELTDNTISGNVVTIAGSYSTPNGYGGGIFASSSTPTLRGNLISGNAVQASNNSNARGGGLHFSASTADLINNTISGNLVHNDAQGVYAVTEGDGMYATGSTLTLVNTILWNGGVEEIFVSPSGNSQPLTVAYSDMQGGQSAIVNSNNVTLNWLAGNLNADPLFVDAANGDFQLRDGSPAVDAGTVFFEWAGQTLVDLGPAEYNSSAPDMGAFESVYIGSVNQPPVAQAAANITSGVAPLSIQFSAAGSSDADGTIVSYAWDFGNGSNSTEADPAHTYANAGVYQATLTVTDDGGLTATADVVITVNPAAGAADSIYLSSSSNGNVGGVAFRDEDILAYDPNLDTWSLYFDGSDIGIGSVDVDAFTILDDGTLLFSLHAPLTIAGLGSVDDSDILQFVPTSLGGNTVGTLSFYFRGADVGLTTNGEDVDSIGFAPDGRLLISTAGGVSVPGASGNDEDLLAFTATATGVPTSGTWERYFDGSNVRLTTANEDLWALSVGDAGILYLSTRGAVNVSGFSGNGADILSCVPNSLGANSTSCTFAEHWRGADHGFGAEIIDAIAIGVNSSVTAASSPNENPSFTAAEEEADVGEAEEGDDPLNGDVDDAELGVDTVMEIYIPLVNR